MAAMKQPHLAVYLSDDILVNILSRLPTPDLCRFKCVSKQWHSSLVPLILAQRPNLAFFGITCKKKPCFLSFSDDGRIHDDSQHHHQLPLSTIFDNGRWPLTGIVGVCNGAAIVCLRTGRPKTRNRIRLGNPVAMYAVYNPFTRQTSMIRPPPHAKITSRTQLILAFDPRFSSHRFKVVCFKHPDPLVYTSETKKWRPFRSREPLTSGCSIGTGSSCMNGKAYRLVFDRSHVRDVIVAFDIKEEFSWSIASPGNPIEGHLKYRTLGESAGHLCYAHYNSISMSLHVWVLDDPSSGKWISRHNVNLQLQLFWSSTRCLLFFHPVDDEVLFVTTTGTQNTYNFKRSELREVAKLEQIQVNFLSPYLCPL